MPSTNPRLQVILPKDVMAIVSKLAKLQGRSRSAVARDFMVEIAPVLARVANTLEAAQAMDEAGRATLIANLEAVQEGVAGTKRQMDLLLDRGMTTTTRKRRAASARQRRASAAAAPRRGRKPPYQ